MFLHPSRLQEGQVDPFCTWLTSKWASHFFYHSCKFRLCNLRQHKAPAALPASFKVSLGACCVWRRPRSMTESRLFVRGTAAVFLRRAGPNRSQQTYFVSVMVTSDCVAIGEQRPDLQTSRSCRAQLARRSRGNLSFFFYTWPYTRGQNKNPGVHSLCSEPFLLTLHRS